MQQANALDMSHLCITEHGNISGWLDFYDAAKDAGVSPGLGIELYQARKSRFNRDEEEFAIGKAADEFAQRGPHHLTVIAKNQTGYKNAIKLSSRAFLEGYFGKPRADMELIAECGEGLIILSGCLSGKIQQAILRDDYDVAYQTAVQFQEIVGRENFGIEVMNHGIPDENRVLSTLVELANNIGAPIIPTCDSHYAVRSDAHFHDAMLCISTASFLEDENRFRFFNDEFYLKSYDEMALLFPEEWLRNTVDLAESINIDLNFDELHFPEFNLPPGREVNEYLDELVWAGVSKRYPNWQSDNAVRDRIEYELRVIKQMNFQHYFLVVGDIVRWAKANGVRTGVGRGSAAGSCISYVLEITDLDPIRFGLLFERFLIEGRKNPPDIDLDFDDSKRELVIDYIKSLYGTDRVAQIATFASVGAKSAIRDAARVLNLPYADGDRVASLVPKPALGVAKSLKECLTSSEFKKEYETNEVSKTIVDLAIGLENKIRQSGIHPAGIVIAPGPIIEYMPVMRFGDDKPIVTQWDMHAIDRNGLLKVDCLGIRNLRIIDTCLRLIKKHYDIDLDVDNLKLDDEKVFEQIAQGKTIGVFQLESGGIRQMASDMRPSNFDEVAALIALYRPGPMGSGMDDAFINRKHGRSQVNYYHPKLANVLDTTYGVMLYQEDILNVAKVLANFNPAEADDLRKAVGKKEMHKIGLFREKFVKGCVANGIKDTIANKVYSDIEYFGGYGFGKSHSYSYGWLVYVTQYLKAHYPAAYMAAALSSVTKNQEKASIYLNECRNMNIKVNPPSINSSEEEFKLIADDEILFGFGSIEGIGSATSQYMVNGDRNYKSVWDFLARTDVELINKKTIESLIYSGAMDELIEDQPQRFLHRSEKEVILNLEKDKLGLYVSDHPLYSAAQLLANYANYNIVDLLDLPNSSTVKVGGIITKVEKKTTKRGDPMRTFWLEDLTNSVECLAWSNQVKLYDDLIAVGNIVIVEGNIKKEGDDENPRCSLLTRHFEKPDLSEVATGASIVLHLENESTELLAKINQIIEDNPGNSLVYLHIKSGKHKLILSSRKPTSLNIKDQLEQLVQLDNLLQEQKGL